MKKIFYSILIFLLILFNFSTVCADDVDNEVDFEDTIEVTASNVSELPKQILEDILFTIESQKV